MDERRDASRIESSLTCTVAGAESSFEATIVELSKLGAELKGPSGNARVDEGLTVLVERVGTGDAVALPATVVRLDVHVETTTYAVQFEALPPDAEAQLDALLAWLVQQPGGGSRAHPRVASRVKVACTTKESFSAYLENLSRGGLAIRCPRPVAPGDSMAVEFLVKEVAPGFEVRARVLRCELQGDGNFKVAVQFDPPSDEQRAKAQAALMSLLDAPAVSP